ncbi:MAG: hypothetical protein ABII93_03825 [Chrysiogenia bacterium]
MFETKALLPFLSLFGSFGYWILVLICYLVLGIWNLSRATRPLRGRTNQIRQGRRMICAAGSPLRIVAECGFSQGLMNQNPTDIGDHAGGLHPKGILISLNGKMREGHRPSPT